MWRGYVRVSYLTFGRQPEASRGTKMAGAGVGSPSGPENRSNQRWLSVRCDSPAARWKVSPVRLPDSPAKRCAPRGVGIVPRAFRHAATAPRTDRSRECRSRAPPSRAPARRSVQSRSWTRETPAEAPGARCRPGRPAPPPRRLPDYQPMMPRSRKASITFAASTSGDPSRVGRRISGSKGAS